MLYGSEADNAISELIIGAAIDVHSELGPGLLESVYESALCYELDTRRIVHARQIGVPLFYKGQLTAEHRPDLVAAHRVVVEVKASRGLSPFTRRKC